MALHLTADEYLLGAAYRFVPTFVLRNTAAGIAEVQHWSATLGTHWDAGAPYLRQAAPVPGLPQWRMARICCTQCGVTLGTFAWEQEEDHGVL